MEFQIDHTALAKKLKALGAEPGEDGMFSTSQICAAKFGAYEHERARKMREDADKKQIENAKNRGTLIERDAVEAFIVNLCTNIRQVILGSTMPANEKTDILKQLEDNLNAGTATQQTITP